VIERARIVSLASRVKDANGVLVALVRAEGSSYRKPGARLLAVVAEAQACCMGKPASFRRLLSSDVIMQMSRGDASQYTQAQCALELRAD
jgi:hypothetical protein